MAAAGSLSYGNPQVPAGIPDADETYLARKPASIASAPEAAGPVGEGLHDGQDSPCGAGVSARTRPLDGATLAASPTQVSTPRSRAQRKSAAVDAESFRAVRPVHVLLACRQSASQISRWRR
jgi:hypothetical protein